MKAGLGGFLIAFGVGAALNLASKGWVDLNYLAFDVPTEKKILVLGLQMMFAAIVASCFLAGGFLLSRSLRKG